MRPRAGSKALIREINEALILDVVRAHAPVARAAISTRTGLSPATVTGITTRLLQAGLLTETDIAPSPRGRPARLLELGRDTVLAAGVELSATEAYAVLVNLRGEVVTSHREPLASTTPQDAVRAVVAAVRTAAARKKSAALTGVGVAVSGVVDHAGGVVRHSGSLGWKDVPFQAQLAAALNTPVSVDSYVNSVASGLLLFDSRLAGRDLLVFSVGMSLGASMVVRGRIHRGYNGTAGGFAHTHVNMGADRPCHCGAADCLETWSSRWGIDRERERRAAATASTSTSASAPASDDDLTTAAGEVLGTGMANAAKTFGPERVVVAIGREMDLPGLPALTAEAFRRQYAHEHSPAPAFESAPADESALAQGAAYTVLARMFTTDIAQPDDGAGQPGQGPVR